MRMMSPTFYSRSVRSRGSRLLGACFAAACLFVLLAASPALAVVTWTITSTHGPQNMAPSGTGLYVFQAYNVGTTNTTTPYTISDTLPTGVTATGFVGTGWSCPNLVVSPIVCTHAGSPGSNLVRPPGTTTFKDATFRGAAVPLTLKVALGASPAGDNSVTVSGGGAVSPTTIVDPSTFSSTPAEFGFFAPAFVADAFDAAAPTGGSGGNPVRQAGAHPFEVRVNFGMNLTLGSDPELGPFSAPDQHVKTLETKLPAGLIGNPQATPQCDPVNFNEPGPGSKGFCPSNTQVGSTDLSLQEGTGIDLVPDVPVYNMVPPKGTVAAFAISFISRPVWIYVSLDPADHYSVIATVKDTTEVLPPRGIQLTLWGVPADPAHDRLRMNPHLNGSNAMNTPFTGDIKPFLTLPSLCGVPAALQMRADSWDSPGAFTPFITGSPITLTGCDDSRFSFQPSISVQPESKTPSTPTALDVDLSVPQKADTVLTATDLYAQNSQDAAIATPPLLNASVVLPEGMSVSPSSADGLAACSPLQIGLGNNDEPTCPDASKIGTVSIDTPLLADPLTGDIYLASQDDNPFGSTLAIYLVARGPGVMIKLPGEVVPDPVTGQLTTTFPQNPPLPFSHLRLHFNGGPRAALVTPPTCGTKTTTGEFQSWNLALPPAQASDSFDISADGAGAPCAPRGFDPGFKAGTKDSTAGKDSPLTTRFTRSDSDEELSKIDVSLPQGLLGRLASVVLCSDVDGTNGTCPDSSKIGTATVAAGPGSNPFYITDGKVFMTGPYKGAPFGLSILVHAKAGPFDLGNVVVRTQVLVDRTTAALRIVSDPMPTILDGIPLEIRTVDVTVDKPGFTFNPTNCSVASSSATLTSTGGQTSTKSSRFQAGDCGALPFAPKMAFRVGGKGHTGSGASTSLEAIVRMTPGQANLKSVKVVLPTTLNARLDVVNNACTLAEFHAGNCAKARAGTAVAVTPLLRDPLVGGAYFVKNGHPLPDLMVALRGQVDFDLDGKVTIPGSKHLATNFDTIPDVPITKFALRLVSGSHGPVGVVTNLCSASAKRARVGITFGAQNGKVVTVSQRLSIAGCAKTKATGGTARAHRR